MNDAVSSVGKGSNRSESFTFTALPESVAELQALPEATLDSAFKTTALTIVALCAYEKNPDACIEMLNFLKGPAEVSTYEKGFIKERLNGKFYKTFSFFEGATPENGYKPDTPFVIKVSENPYSFDEENWATLYVTSGGADNPRPIKLRKKPSTGQWFLNDIQCLADIRVPVADDPWA
ncbi:MAG: hypothetical protein IJZ95_04255 [Oscillospiraceae bacterium]|nr:hypothetical protein [Oscillospiraceae bacterium]